MNAFRPTSKPLWKKILISPILHVCLIALLVLAAALYIREKHHEELRAKVEYLKSGPLLVERQDASTMKASGNSKPEVDSSATDIGEDDDFAPGFPIPAATATPAPTALPVETAVTPTPAASNHLLKSIKASDSKFAKKFTTVYAEIDSRIVNTWMDEMRSTGQARVFDEAVMGPLLQVQQKLKLLRGVKILSRMEHQIAPNVLSMEWFIGTHRSSDPENEIGFFSSLSLGDSKDGIVRGDVEVQRAFREPQSAPGKGIERVSFGGPFELPVGAGFMMRGILPKRFATELDEEANPDPALSILKSRSFAAGESDFVFILVFDPPATSTNPKNLENK